MKSLKSAIFLLLLGISFTLQAKTAEEALETLLKSPSIDPEAVAVVIADLEDGSLLAAHNADKALLPASIMKTATTAAMIQKNPSNKPLITKVFIDGPIVDGKLDGNLIVVGSGDPSLNGNDDRAKSADFVVEIVQAVSDKGITSINGSIIIDESVFSGKPIPDSWQADDLPYAYGTGSHGFNFEKNSSNKASVKDPSGVFKKKLKTAFSNKNISLKEGEAGGGKRQLIVEHKSAPLNDIMHSCMVRSDNLYAESILRLFGVESVSDVSTDEAAREAMNLWKKAGLPMENVLIVDGSGLSRKNRVTGRFMTMMLAKMKNNRPYTDLFPRVGKEGTVKSFLKDTELEGKMALKTGSMRGVQCYAGYKLNDKGQPVMSVVVIVNNLKDRAKFKTALAKFFQEIF